MREIGGRVGALVAVLAVFVSSTTASAATLKASYPLQGGRGSQLAGAPDLADVGPGNRFATKTVDGASREVLAFPRSGGVSLRTSGLVDPTSHSIVMTLRLHDVSGFRRLLDFSGGRSDSGLYVADGRAVLYSGGEFMGSSDRVVGDGYAQVALTSEVTLAGSQWSVVYVNGTPVAAATTPEGFGLGSSGLRFFKDNVHGAGRGEQSAGALACVLVYDGALTAAEVAQVAGASSPCPAPRPAPPPHLPYRAGSYQGRTSQGLPIFFTVDGTAVEDVSFEWRARCADGRVHRNGISLGGGSIRRGRFDVHGLLGTGGRARVIGRLRGSEASGKLSRWANSAFDTVCVARGVRWHARLVRGTAPLL